jgi:uncharacterized protein
MTISRLVPAGILLALSLAFTPAYAQEVPVNDGFVTDEAGLLSQEEEESLELTLTTYQRETSNEIAVLIMKSLSGADISEFAVEVGRKWAVGTAENDNGILILVGYDSRDVNISTGYGLEGAVPDIVAAGIIREDIAPKFRDGEYYAGLNAAVDSLKKHIGGEYTAERYETSGGGEGIIAWGFFLVFILFDFFAALFARSKSWWLGGFVGAIFGIVLTIMFTWWISIPVLMLLGLFFDYIVSKNGSRRGGRGGRGGWGGGGFGSGGGSGGFGGFGGGSFGGGGASGKW